MDLKRILLPVAGAAEEALYYHRDENTTVSADGSLQMKMGAVVSFDTYFNSFSTGKWKKYTVVEKLQLALKIKGRVQVSLSYQYLDQKQVVSETISTHEISGDGNESHILDFGANRDQGMYSFELLALAEDSVLIEGRYLAEHLMPKNLKVNLMIDICTFRREEYVYRNLKVMKEKILDNPDSPLYRHMYVHISDNAKTLDSSVADGEFVKISPNRNVGGVGGFTRGIIEALNKKKQRDISHVLLMDDDAVIEPACLETTYNFLTVLRDEYQDYTMAGAIMQLDKPWRQYEEGAQWNQGAICALKYKKDMRKVKNLLANEDESEKVEYAGWWYACIPLSVIDKNNLPLPIFIHRDDVEYGLRTGKGFIYLNGVCVWHEAFENKTPGPLEYYDIRNLAIVNAVHYPEYGAAEFKKILTKWMLGNILRYRYKYVDFNLRAVEDFCKGIDWFLKQEAEPLHKEVAGLNYKAQPKEAFIGYMGIKEQDFDWEMLMDPNQKKKYPKWLKILHLLTLNGYLLPAKKSKVMVTSPYVSIHDIFRSPEVIFIDAAGNSVSTKRSFSEMIAAVKKMHKARKLIDQHYETAKVSYHERYREMTNMDFWRKYLEM